jgi:hypothetical protein
MIFEADLIHSSSQLLAIQDMRTAGFMTKQKIQLLATYIRQVNYAHMPTI